MNHSSQDRSNRSDVLALPFTRDLALRQNLVIGRRECSFIPQRPFRSGRRHGAAAVEFALIAPLFFLLLAGIIEIGQAFRIEHAISNAARRGVRSAIVKGSTVASVTAVVKGQISKTLKNVAASDVIVEVALNGTLNSDLSHAVEGDEVRVTVGIPFSKAGSGFYAQLFSKTTLSSTSILEHE